MKKSRVVFRVGLWPEARGGFLGISSSLSRALARDNIFSGLWPEKMEEEIVCNRW
jgi:hypothetical protein